MPRHGHVQEWRVPGLIEMALWGLAFAWLLFGCAGQLELASPESPDDAHGHRLTAVPFFPDDTDQCGPATLASVLTYWGVPTDPPTLKKHIYSSRLRGSLPFDLQLTAQALGLKAEGYKGSLENVRSELDAGHPLVAFLNLGFGPFPQGHYVVITGYDDRRQGVYVHSGLERDEFVSYRSFLRSWEKTGRWTLRVLPPEGRGKTHA
jgi:ABC-type bacteriocin/lantibiotic exporter with double-glycine peptidase domain